MRAQPLVRLGLVAATIGTGYCAERNGGSSLLSQGVPDPQSNIQFAVVNPIVLPVGSCDMQILRLVIKHIKTKIEKFHIESLSEDYPGVCKAAGQTLNKKKCCLC